ncbi:MAG TPA: LysM peptidoglycan-binding domain-containing protein [Desulfomonilia bacterium]
MKKVIPLITGFFFLLAFGAAWADDSEIVHTVKKGDTLWDISNKYLKTPWKWPLVWAENDKITNPHLIYPGDKIVIFSQNGVTSIKVIPYDKTSGERIFSFDDFSKMKGRSIVLSPEFSTLIYSDNPLKLKGRVLKKVENGDLSTTDDQILIKGFPDAKPGKVLVIKSLQNDVKVDDEVYGYLYKIVALAKVDNVEKDIAICTVTYSYQEISGNDLVDDDITGVKPLTLDLSENKGFGESVIIDVWHNASGGGNGDLVFIDRGTSDGLKPGNILNIYKDVPVKDGKTTKDINAYAGTAVVIQTVKNSAIVLITYATMYIEQGFVVSGK